MRRVTEMSRAIFAAAAETGIDITHLPVFYAHTGFDGAAPTEGQGRFVAISTLMRGWRSDAYGGGIDVAEECACWRTVSGCRIGGATCSAIPAAMSAKYFTLKQSLAARGR